MGNELFKLGQVISTPRICDKLAPAELQDILKKHVLGDWGVISVNDQKENEFSVENGFRILSAYMVRGMKVYVITEADRSATTVLFPDEY